MLVALSSFVLAAGVGAEPLGGAPSDALWSKTERSTGLTLDPDRMGGVLLRFARLFAVDRIEAPPESLSDRAWGSLVARRLAESGRAPWTHPEWREALVDFLATHPSEFRAAWRHAEHFLRVSGSTAIWSKREIEIGCALGLGTVGLTVGGGWLTAWAWDVPYGAWLGLAPVALVASREPLARWARQARMRRLARRAAPDFEILGRHLAHFGRR